MEQGILGGSECSISTGIQVQAQTEARIPGAPGSKVDWKQVMLDA